MAVPSPDRNKVECGAGDGHATGESAGPDCAGLAPVLRLHLILSLDNPQTSRSHFKEKEMEAAGGEVKCPDSHSHERGGGSACLMVSPAGHSCVV